MADMHNHCPPKEFHHLKNDDFPQKMANVGVPEYMAAMSTSQLSGYNICKQTSKEFIIIKLKQ